MVEVAIGNGGSCGRGLLCALHAIKRVEVHVLNLFVGVLVQRRIRQMTVEPLGPHVHGLAQTGVLHEHKIIKRP